MREFFTSLANRGPVCYTGNSAGLSGGYFKDRRCSPMTAERVDRKRLKADVRELFRTAQVSPKGMAALYLGLVLALNFVDALANNRASEDLISPVGLFVTILTTLLAAVLGVGFVLYCMAIRRGERAEYLTLFDGFSFVGKIIALELVMSLFIMLWSMLFVIPGIVAGYRYRFAMYNLCENPGIGVMEALDMSKRQTWGYKGQLFILDWSYFGWELLSTLPIFAVVGYLVNAAVQMASGGSYVPWSLYLHPGQILMWMILAGVWAFVVELFYLPNRQCVELGYFEIAKRTSGVGAREDEPPQLEDGGWTGGWGEM